MGQGEGAAWKTVGHHSSHKIVLPSQDGLDWPGLEKCKVKGAFIASEACPRVYEYKTEAIIIIQHYVINVSNTNI